MKRIALLTVLLLVVGLAGFAIDVKPTLALTGSASVTWGYDLDTGANGFKNVGNASFTLSLLAADGTDTHAGTGDMYGSITISNIEFFWLDIADALVLDDGYGPDPTDDASADIAAKIIITPFEIGVYAAPSMTQDFFGAFEDADVPDLVVDDGETAFAMAGGGWVHTMWGTWVTATLGPAAITAKVVSDGDWTDSTTGYAFGGEAVLTFTPLTVSAGAYYGYSALSGYAKVLLDMAPINVWGAVEVNMPGGLSAATGDTALGLGGGLTFTIVADTTLAATAWFADAYSGLDLNVVFTEPGDKGLIPMLDTSITFNLLDVGTIKASEWELVTLTGYKIGLNSDATNYVRPFVNFTYGDANDGAVGSTGTTVMNATVGVQFQVIPLTLLTAQWVSGADLGADLASDPAVMGSIQFMATVTY